MESLWAVVIAIVPSIGVGLLFYKVLKAIIEGDRNERLAHAQWEAHQDAEAVNDPNDQAVAPGERADQTIQR